MKNVEMRMKNGLARLVCVSLILHFSFFTFHSASAQIAGMNTLTLLDLGSGARASGLGFDYLVLPDGDISVAIDNASMLGLWDDNQNQYFMAGLVELCVAFLRQFNGHVGLYHRLRRTYLPDALRFPLQQLWLV